jgi:ABC-2 type transport system ATP-binding protein
LECKKEIAYVPDNPDLYENMKAIDFINFICDMYEIPENIRKENITKYSKMLEMENHLNESISSFSHGMKQKIALISALAHEPKILIMDEPFVGLDPKAVFDLKNVMKEMCSKGKSIFFSTHILDVAEKLCDRVAIIKNGKIVKIGNMNDIKGDESLEQVFLELEEK